MLIWDYFAYSRSDTIFTIFRRHFHPCEEYMFKPFPNCKVLARISPFGQVRERNNAPHLEGQTAGLDLRVLG